MDINIYLKNYDYAIELGIELLDSNTLNDNDTAYYFSKYRVDIFKI